MIPQLQSMNDEKVYHSLCMKIGAKRWARAFSPLRRYRFMTSNVAESLNSALRNARKFPVSTVLEFIRGLIQKWFHERGEKAAERTEVLTEHVTKIMMSNKAYADFMAVKAISSYEFQVLDGTRERFVNLQDRTCSCRKFQLDLLPCAHAIVAIRWAGQELYSYCAEYFKSENLRQLYSAHIYPVGHPDDWQVPTEIKSQNVLPPLGFVSAGHPQKTRFPSAGEKRRTRRKQQVCYICKKAGHNRLKCPNENVIGLSNPSDMEEVPEVSRGRRRRTNGVRRCSSCGQSGHTRLTCQIPRMDSLEDDNNFSHPW
ncbi:hypothetical protein PTKIN_Ptkin13bG0035600 [Pterospermum kingtungense]